MQILSSFTHILEGIEEGHKLARKIRREFHVFHSLGSEKWTPV